MIATLLKEPIQYFRSLLVVASLFLFAFQLVAQDAKMQLQFVKDELAHLRSIVGLSLEDSKSILDAIQPFVDKRGSELENNPFSITAVHLDRKIGKTLYRQAEKFLDQKALVPYVENQKKIWDYEDSNSAQLVVLYLDSQLALSADQRTQITRLLESHWNPEWNRTALLMLYNGYSLGKPIIDSIERESLSKILTPKQIEVFSNLESLAPGFQSLVDQGNMENWQPSFQQDVLQFLDLELAQLTNILELSETQQKKLRIGAKGAILQMIKYRERVLEKTNGDFFQSPSVLGAMMDSTLVQFRKEKIWKKSIRKTLDEQLISKLDEAVRQRQHQEAKAVAYVTVHQFTLGLPIPYQDLTKLDRLFFETLVDSPSASLYESLFYAYNKITPEQMQDSISETAWKLVRDKFENIQSKLPKLEDDKLAEILNEDETP